MANNTKSNTNDIVTEQDAADTQEDSRFSFKVEHLRFQNSLTNGGITP
jgi:hypothetical protein